jgi:hypothetical protein
VSARKVEQQRLQQLLGSVLALVGQLSMTPYLCLHACVCVCMHACVDTVVAVKGCRRLFDWQLAAVCPAAVAVRGHVCHGAGALQTADILTLSATVGCLLSPGTGCARVTPCARAALC